MSELFLVMPVYNEAVALARVLQEWLRVLERLGCSYRFLCLDDGSTDATPQVLASLREDWPSLQVVSGPNRGHGASCLLGYARALESGAPWIFQLDSDGQCDPLSFASFWAARSRQQSLYGYRWPRHDGVHRFFISQLVGLTVWLKTGVRVADANVPYRLLHREGLAACLQRIPADFHLANIALAVLQARRNEILWRRVPFWPRAAGVSNQSLRGLPARAVQLWRQLGELSSSNS